MPEKPIRELELSVKTSAQTASSGIDSLVASLTKLRDATKGMSGLSTVSKNLSNISTAINSIGSANMGKIDQLAIGLGKLQKLQGVKISTNIATQLREIGTATSSISKSSTDKIGMLATALSKFGNLGRTNLNSFVSPLKQLPQLFASLESMNMGNVQTKLQQVADAFKPLSEMGKSSISSTVNSLGKLPALMDKLESLDMSKLKTQIEQLAKSFQPLATEMEKIAAGFSAMPTKLQTLIRETDKIPATNTKAAKSYVNLAAKMGISYALIRRVTSVISGWVTESNKYVEDMNLFTVAMGEYAEASQDYAEEVASIMGIDPAEWMRNQGLFMTLATGFGVTSERAAIMSKNLTQLGYDLSSFFNLPTKDTFLKLQSGLAGELEPLRRIGFDLSVARLQQEAYNLGINKSITAMTQAEKAELRYYAILTQVTTAHGDMARTLESPANQLRILKSAVTQAGRALGNIFIPALNAIIPYAIAAMNIIRELANTIANFFGFALPTIDYSGLENTATSAGDLAENIGSAAGGAKELQKTLLGIDELNILPSKNAGGGGGGTGTTGDSGFDFELPEYDFIGDALTSRVDAIQKKFEPVLNWLKDNMDDILQIAINVGATLLAWKLASGFVNAIKNASTGLNRIGMGITLLVTGITLEWQGAYDIGYNGPSFGNIVKTAIGAALGVGGSLLLFGTGPLGWTIGIGISLITTILGITIGADDRAIAEEMKKRFGELVLSSEEITAVVKATLDNDWYSEVQLYLDVEANLDELRNQINGQIEDINKYRYKVNLGLELSEAEMDSYRKTLENYAKSASQYVSDRGYAIEVGVRATVSNQDLADSILSSSSEITSLVNADLESLGKELQETLNTAFSDGILTIDEQKAIDDLTKQINEILQVISESKFEAQMDFIDLKFGVNTGELSQESWEAYKSELNKVADEMKATAEETVQGVLTNLQANVAIAELNLEKDPDNAEYKRILANAEKALQDYIDSNPLEAEVNDIDVTIANTLYDRFVDAFQDELDKTQPAVEDIVTKAFDDGILAGMSNVDNVWEMPIENIVNGVTTYWSYTIHTLNISNETREVIRTQLGDSIPKLNQLQSELQAARAAGLAVPQAIKDGLTDIYTFKTMSDNVSEQMQGITYLIGYELSQSPSFAAMLQNAENVGMFVNKELALGITSNLSFVKDASGQFVNIVQDGVGTIATVELTEDVINNLNALGVEMTDVLKNGFSSGLSGFNSAMWNTMDIIDRLIKKAQQIPTSIPGTIGGSKGPGGSWKIPGFASGGQVATGQLFMAREAGPELVGTMGGRTTVANNDQIVEGIAQGVYKAVVAAMGESGSQDIYIDGEKVFSVVKERNNRERIRTGVNPLMV